MASDTDDLLTIRDLIRWGASRFTAAGLYFGHGTDNALDEAVQLVLPALHLTLDLPPAYLGARLTASERHLVLELLWRRLEERLPVAYLTGKAWFAGLEFSVDERALVPRSPIAELIEAQFRPWLDPGRLSRVLDLCAGGGCIGIATAVQLPEAQVDLVDISAPALAVARRNLFRYGLGGRVRLIQSDLFAGLKGRYDLILCNPPYVNSEELAGLPAEYQREPALGLDGGPDGLAVVRRILKAAAEFLEPGGAMILEVGSSAEALLAAYPQVPFLWLEFERGGEGVCLLTAEQLLEHRPQFEEAATA